MKVFLGQNTGRLGRQNHQQLQDGSDNGPGNSGSDKSHGGGSRSHFHGVFIVIVIMVVSIIIVALVFAAVDLLETRKTEFHGKPYAVIQPKSKIDFIQLQVRMAQINTWSLEAVADTNFALKWKYGVPRPEEVAFYIYQTDKEKLLEQYTGKEAIPETLITKIKDMNLKDAFDFTAYKDAGSPMHPSFPAMHSAGSTCSLWVPALYKITAEQYTELVLTDFAVAYARTVAGVHYPQDNIAGLNIG